jgi:hypothetical protein
LSAAARADISTTDVVLPIRQSEIYVFVPIATGGAGFGLIGALIDAGIDSARTSNAEKAVTPLRNALVDYSFETTFQEQLKDSLSQVPWLHASGFGVVRDISNDGLERAISASKASSVLFVVADYRLSNDGDVLLVTLEVALMPNNEQLKALIPGKPDTKNTASLVNALYRNRILFEAHVNSTGDRDKNVAEWSANNGSAARAALKMAAKKLTPILAEDIQRAESDVGPTATTTQVAVAPAGDATECQFPASQAQCGNSAVLLNQDQDGQTFRFKDGSLKYLKTGNF